PLAGGFEEREQRLLNCRRVKILNDKDQSGCTIVIRPTIEVDRRVYHLLNPMQHQRTSGADDVQQAFYPKHLCAMPVEESREPDAKGAPIHSMFNAQRECLQL